MDRAGGPQGAAATRVEALVRGRFEAQSWSKHPRVQAQRGPAQGHRARHEAAAGLLSRRVTASAAPTPAPPTTPFAVRLPPSLTAKPPKGIYTTSISPPVRASGTTPATASTATCTSRRRPSCWRASRAACSHSRPRRRCRSSSRRRSSWRPGGSSSSSSRRRPSSSRGQRRNSPGSSSLASPRHPWPLGRSQRRSPASSISRRRPARCQRCTAWSLVQQTRP
jgi:hypothetical protein